MRGGCKGARMYLIIYDVPVHYKLSIHQMATPKYPRVQVSGKRHNALAAEAKKRGISITQLAEEKFKKAK